MLNLAVDPFLQENKISFPQRITASKLHCHMWHMKTLVVYGVHPAILMCSKKIARWRRQEGFSAL